MGWQPKTQPKGKPPADRSAAKRLLIKGVKMPDCCASCPFLTYDDYVITGKPHTCLALKISMGWDDLPQGRREDCPLIEEKTGKWVWNNDARDWNIGAWICSECGAKPETHWESKQEVNPLLFCGSKYCPNCGARMDEE